MSWSCSFYFIFEAQSHRVPSDGLELIMLPKLASNSWGSTSLCLPSAPTKVRHCHTLGQFSLLRRTWLSFLWTHTRCGFQHNTHTNQARIPDWMGKMLSASHTLARNCRQLVVVGGNHSSLRVEPLVGCPSFTGWLHKCAHMGSINWT